VLLLIAWGGLSYSETAQALGVPAGTVRSRLSRARGSVRQSLAGAAIPRTRSQENPDG
jgi:RNA polymerase sigma-70 factor (ECF subfamily)